MLDKGRLQAGIETALRSATQGEDSVAAIASAIADAIVNEFYNADVVMPSCNGGGIHPIGSIQ